MYYDGSIASRLRELQREADASYARVNFIQNQLGYAYDKIRDLEKENLELKSELYTLSFNNAIKDEVPEVVNSEVIDISNNSESIDSDRSKARKTKK
jgi:hypothetical protein